MYKILLSIILEHEIPTKVILKLVKFEVEGLLKIDVFINAVVDNLTLKLYIVFLIVTVNLSIWMKRYPDLTSPKAYSKTGRAQISLLYIIFIAC